MFDFYVQPNFLLSEFACSHCRKKYKENRDNTRPEMKMFAQAVRDELNWMMSFIEPDYNPKIAEVTVNITGTRCYEHNDDLIAYYNYCVKNNVKPLPNKPIKDSNHPKGRALDISAKYKGEKLDPELINEVCLKVGKKFGLYSTYWIGYKNTTKHVHCNFKYVND